MDLQPSHPPHEDEEDEVIPPSWETVLASRRRGPAQHSLAGRVAAAIAFGRSQVGVDESLDDIAGEQGGEKFAADREAGIAALGTMREAVMILAALSNAPPFADPALAAVMQTFGCPLEEAERILAQHLQLLALSHRGLEAPVKRGRGRPLTRSPVVRAVVRAAMHYLYISKHRISGGWSYASKRTRERTAKRSVGAELTSNRAAAFVARVVRNAGLEADRPEIKGHMTEYVKELNKAKRAPAEQDYT